MIEDFKKIEKKLYLNENIINFEKIFNNNFQKLDYNLLEMIYYAIKSDDDKFFKKKINNILLYINNSICVDAELNSEKVLSMYLALFVYKNIIFNKIKKDNFSNPHFISSDELINNISNDFFLFIISIEIKHNKVLECGSNLIRSILASILANLSNKKIISIKKMHLNNKTKIYYFLNKNTFVEAQCVKIYYNSFKKYTDKNGKIYIYSEHYTSIYPIFKQNKHSNSIFEISKKSKLIEKLCDN